MTSCAISLSPCIAWINVAVVNCPFFRISNISFCNLSLSSLLISFRRFCRQTSHCPQLCSFFSPKYLNSIRLRQFSSAEAYSIKVGKKTVEVSASSLNGFNYAIQTIKQMLPAEIYGKTVAAADLPVMGIGKSIWCEHFPDTTILNAYP